MSVAPKYDWMFLKSVVLLTVSILDFYQHQLLFCPISGLFLFLGMLYNHRDGFTAIHAWGGLPNLITLTRLALLFSLPFIDRISSAGILCLLVVCLDGLDGFAARKLNQISEFGGYLDMEVDAFFCLIFSLAIAIQNAAMEWILIGGLLRYLYKIITTLLQKKGYTERKKKYARFLAGCYFTSFILYFFLYDSIGWYCLSIGTGLVIVSFAISFYEFLIYKTHD